MAARRAGLKLTTHDLRHTYAATAIAAGMSPFILAAQLGHRPSTTENFYGHLFSGTPQRAADLLDRRQPVIEDGPFTPPAEDLYEVLLPDLR